LAKKSVYRPEDLAAQKYEDTLGDPGEFPFTRGVYAGMYGTRLWTMRQYAGYATAEESNRRYRYLLEQGTTGLSVAFDLPTQIGLDSDDPLAVGEVGRVGVAIDTLADMERLFDGIPLGEISCSMTINATAAVLLAMYLVAARKQGVPWSSLRGTVQNDILKEYLARGTYIFPPAPSMRLVTDVFEFCAQEVPLWNTISVSGYHIREAGSSAAQELAFTLANAETYVAAAIEAGLEVDSFAPRISFFFSSHNRLFEEIAKFRAARRMWARTTRGRFGARKEASWKLRFHAQTAGSTLTAQQPDNNVVRVAYQALAAVLGGAQSLHTNSRDEALALPTEAAVQLALRTQQVLAFETGAAEVADPLGGSWYVESLTNALEKEAEQYLDRIRSMGGMLRAIESGYAQAEIAESAYRQQTSMESGELKVVGVNDFTVDSPVPLETLRINPETEKRQRKRLRSVRSGRNMSSVESCLDSVRKAAASGENLIPPIIEAVQEYVTIGEISGVLREVFGEYSECTLSV